LDHPQHLVILAGSIVFIYRHVPETKGMTLEEIEAYFLSYSKEANGGGGDNESGKEVTNEVVTQHS
jgi:hypothetical protein